MAVPQVAIDAVTHYLQKGIGRGPAIGIVSVCYAGESKLNPGSQGTQPTETGGPLNPSGAYGIASWNGDRQAALQTFATAKGEPVGALNTQLDFILTECANSYSGVWAAIQSGMAYTPFINVFVTQYEKPKDPSSEISRSVAFAQELDAAVLQTVPPAPAPAPSTSGASSVNLVVAAALEQLIPLLVPLLAPTVEAIFKELTAQLGPVIQQTLAAELAKLIPKT